MTWWGHILPCCNPAAMHCNMIHLVGVWQELFILLSAQNHSSNHFNLFYEKGQWFPKMLRVRVSLQITPYLSSSFWVHTYVPYMTCLWAHELWEAGWQLQGFVCLPEQCVLEIYTSPVISCKISLWISTKIGYWLTRISVSTPTSV